MLTLANPAGLWALLGIPAVLAIHFLQRQSVVLPVSTLFLLDKTQRESASGRRFDRLMNSVPLWMQLLGVLLLTWLLAEPRYQKPRSTQRVAIVLDSSASMAVGKDKLKERVIATLPDLQGPAAALELSVLESTPGKPRLYSGSSADELGLVLDAWKPRSGLTDPSYALRLARSLVSREGIVVYVTDTPMETPPFDARVLSIGDKIENVGFTGVSIGEKEGATVWQAMVRNYGKDRTSRSWHLELPDGSKTEPRSFEIGAGSMITLQAAYPQGAPRARLVLSPDDFTLDDVLPMVLPQPKSLAIFSSGAAYQELTKKLVRSLEATHTVNDTSSADLTILSYDPLDPVVAQGNAVVFVHDDTRGGKHLKGGIVAEKHPLIDALNWQALLVRENIQIPIRDTDTVLLRQGDRVLIFLRETPTSRELCFNFDLNPAQSNAAVQPAFIVMLHRFAEELRAAKVAPASENLETSQPVILAASDAEKAPEVLVETIDLAGKVISKETHPAAKRIHLEASLDAGFMRVHQGDNSLLEAAVQFADTREADFSACAPADTLAEGSAAAVERHTDEDQWWRAWFLLLLAALLISWHFTREREARKPRVTPAAPAAPPSPPQEIPA